MTNEQAIQELMSHLEHWERLKTEHIAPVDEATRTIDALLMAIKALSEPSGNLISRADAIEAMGEEPPVLLDTAEEWAERDAWVLHVSALKELPSADAVSREDYHNLLTATEDIDRALREYQAREEQASADAVQGWIPFTRRPMTEEEQKDYPNCTFMFDCVLPDDGDEILVSNGRFVWMDTFCADIDGCYLDGGDDIDEDMAWMPLPEPYKGGEK